MYSMLIRKCVLSEKVIGQLFLPFVSFVTFWRIYFYMCVVGDLICAFFSFIIFSICCVFHCYIFLFLMCMQ